MPTTNNSNKPKNSPLVKGKKYRQLKENNATLTQRNCQLVSEVIHLKNQLANKDTQLAQLHENLELQERERERRFIV